MGSFGANFGNNFAGSAIAIPLVVFPTKIITADLCVNTNVTENLCVTDSIKEDLCN